AVTLLRRRGHGRSRRVVGDGATRGRRYTPGTRSAAPDGRPHSNAEEAFVSAIAGRTNKSLLRSTDFLKLWTGQTVSAFGSQVTILAVPIVAALTLKVSPFEFGLLATIEFLPFVALSLPAGVWVDRLRRRPILISADVG